ncbi:LemA family protein [Candidatus Desantisbacteria bacterium CG1_02_38_46]|uniref:LemA family protein n=2 Tax=unclassified Candidatus Desantisiibacteriota TaxID=3106372 RepID=A0A2H9PAH1_9BACT|nr:MAG: LemA family protein [Candidatus Desantisbacteria bacterium CG1_02_38_46]PIZ15425.1 MAG: LemA family protein [Candidatus Desantisbacteria bacterium CG_4_10_14_0_8_um_filter_39_17]
MKKWIIVIVILLVVIIGLSVFIGGLNKVVRMDESVTEAWAQIDTQLQRRADLIPNLVQTVKGYARHEKEIFEHVADARKAWAGAKSIPDKIAAAGAMEGALARLMLIVERYPDLKANQNFLHLQDQLEGTENRIAVARTRYNRSVKDFNAYIREVFGRMFARLRGLGRPHTYFEISEEAKEVPKVEF